MAGLHVTALWALGVAQPVFDLLGRNAEFFVARDSQPIDIVLFSLALVALPPLALFALEALAWLIHQHLRQVLHLVFIATLVAVIALQVLEDLGDGSSETLLPLSALVGVGAALIYWRVRAVRSFLTVLSPIPPAVLVLFLFASPVSKLVIGGEAEASLADVSASAPVVMLVLDELPVHVSGELRGPGASRGRDLAVAVNGRIAALARSVLGEGATPFDAMLRESALRPGANKVELFAVSQGGRALTLLAQTSAEAPFTLTSGAIRARGGRGLTIGSPGTEGFLEAVAQGGDRLTISGWAVARGRPVERVLVFDGERFVGSAVPRVDRPDVGRSIDAPSRRLGFRLQVSANALDPSGAGVSAFAVKAGRAARLPPLAGLCDEGGPPIVGCD